MPAPCTVQSLTHFPCLQSQATAIIQSPTNSHFFFMAFQLSVVGGFSSELFLKLLPWETGKVKQLTRRHLMNSLLGFTHSKTATSTNRHARSLLRHCLFTLCTHTRTHKHTRAIVNIPHQRLVKPQRHTSPSNQDGSCGFSRAFQS